MKCIYCNKTILNENANYCPECGNTLTLKYPRQSQNVETKDLISNDEISVQNKINAIWPEWKIENNPIGKGSYGTVYKANRTDCNVKSNGAIKIISVPSDYSEISALRTEGMDDTSIKDYFKGIVEEFVGEIQLMESLKGVQNIVSIEDYGIIEKTEEIGWEIIIRMELLTPFSNYISNKILSEKEVIKLGIDICTALEICGKRDIIHRDIKLENIFVNDFGHFKLGDFGVARKTENVVGILSQKGTFNYAAPEIVNGKDYDARVDIYSLGIVLYQLLNRNRLPFMDDEKQNLDYNERREAVERRIRGEKLLAPCDASLDTANAILRACAYDPDMRFATATDMKQELIKIIVGEYQEEVANLDKTTSVRKPDIKQNFEKQNRQTYVVNKNQNVDNFDINIIKTETPKKESSIGIKRVLLITTLTLFIAVATITIWLIIKGDFLTGGSLKSDGQNLSSVTDLSSDVTVESAASKQYKIINDFRNSVASVSSSSQLSAEKIGNNIYNYSPWNLVDNDLTSCWCEGKDDYGIGETITIELDDVYLVSKIYIWNGLRRNEEMYYKNARLREITATFSNGNKYRFALNDNWEQEVCEIILPNKIETSSISITINSVYEGKMYNDTCVSEIRLSSSS